MQSDISTIGAWIAHWECHHKMLHGRQFQYSTSFGQFTMIPTLRSQLVYPRLDYSVTLAEVVDFHVKHNPSEVAYTFAQDGKATHSNISFLEFGRAIHRVAHYIRPVGKNSPDRETVTFVALSDSLLYQAVTLGIIRAGYIVRCCKYSLHW